MKTAFVTLATGNYIIGAAVLYHSLAANSPNSEFDFICITDHNISLGTNSRARFIIQDISRLPPLQLRPRDVSNRFKKTLDKFHFFRFVSLGYDRIIFMDSDMLVTGDVSILFSEILNRSPVWMARDYACFIYHPHALKQARLKPRKTYNTGLIILNCELLNFTLVDILACINSGIISYDGGDQGYLNSFLMQADVLVSELPVVFNYAMDPYYPPTSYEDIRVQHFTGSKPWSARRSQHSDGMRAYLDWYYYYFELTKSGFSSYSSMPLSGSGSMIR